MKKFPLAAILVLLILLPVTLLLLSRTPALELNGAPAAIGSATPVTVRVTGPHGIRRFAAYIDQGDRRYTVYQSETPAHRVLFFTNQPPRQYTFAAGKKTTPELTDGQARLTIEATSNDLRASTASMTREVTIVTRPPSITADDKQHYINQGGSELVTYSLGGYATDSGAKIGGYRFGGFPLPGTRQRFSLFAYPWDLPITVKPLVYAANSADEVTAGFWNRVFPKSFRKRDLVLDDTFLARVVRQIDPSGSGDLITRFLKINGEMRKRNNQTLADLRSKTADKFLWSGPFLQLSNSKVESQFADVRSYIYKGKKVDQQVHLGFDLSKVKNTPVAAANDGRIVLAEKLGIYGNCVVIDHGYTLQSIYGHLSRIQVQPGDMVKKGQTIGLSGSTGLAGGDHLHFSMQVDGVQVNPVEWWDAHWIHDRILSKVSERR